MSKLLKLKSTKIVVALMLGVMLLTSGGSTALAALSTDQVNAILGLLNSFGADATTVSNVQASLTGGTTTTTSSSSTSSNFGTATLRVGSKGEFVKNLQTLVGATADGNFGPGTKAKVMAWQSANGLTADGVFGNASKAKAGGTSTSTTSTTTTTTTTTPVAASGPVSVALATDNPATRSVITSEAGADLAHFAFTGAGTVTSVTLKRVGVSADASLLNVYLYDGATRLTDSASVSSNSMISFNDPNGLFTVSGSKTISVKADLNGASGETLGVSLSGFQALGQTATTLGTPMSGNLFTVATATPAGVTFAAATPGANANLTPASDVVVWQSTATITTRDVYLTRFTIRETGGVAKTDLSNLRLLVGATTVATVANPDANGYVTFVPTTPLLLKTGASVFKVMADVTGGSSLSFTFAVKNKTDVGLVDSQYMVGFLTSSSLSNLAAGQQTVSTGYVTVQKATTSPTSTVVLAGTDVVLARFTATTYGEKVKADSLYVDLTSSATATLRNGRVLIDGNQVGSTATIDPAANTAAGTQFNINHTFLPGTVAVIEVRADIFDNDGTNGMAAGVTVKATLTVGSSNAQGVSSGSTLNFPTATVDGNTLSVSSGSVTLAKDQAYGSQTVVVPTTGTLLGSFNLTSGNTEALTLDTIQVDLTFAGDFGAADLSNVYVMYGAKSTSSKSTVSATAGANTWNISESLAVSSSMTFKVYGDIASGAVVTAGGDTVIPSLLVSGISASGTAVNTNSNAVLAGQTISAVSTGTLTVSLDSATPSASQVVAGAVSDTDGTLKIKLAGTNEDQYVKLVKVYVDTLANSAAVSSIELSTASTSTGSYTAVGSQTLVTDGTNPGYVIWNLSGTGRITVPKNGSVFLKFKSTFVSSGQTAVTGLTPKLFLGNIEAEGTTNLTAGGSALTNSTGIVVRANTASTSIFVDSTENNTAADMTAGATTLVTANGIVFLPGDVIFIDEDAGGDWDVATEELMVVLIDGGANLTVMRGAFGTTAVAYASNTMDIYRLNTATMTTSAGVVGNATTVLNTKLTVALKSDSPSGATTGSSSKYVFGLDVSATNNTADTATNTATLTYVDITVGKSAVTVSNMVAYPSTNDLNATYVTTCGALTTTKWRCTMSTAGSTNQIDEGNTRSYKFYADVGYSGAGSLDFKLANLGTSSTSTNSVYWTDGTTAQYWVNQPTTLIQGGSLTTTASSGSADTTAPTISAIAMGNGTTLNSIDANDTIAITFSEPIDPTTINATLVPGGSVTGVTGASTGTVTVAQATAIVTVAGITTFDSGASVAVAVSAPTVTLALNSSSTILTITITALTGGGVITTPAGGAGTQVVTTVTDANGVASAAVASAAATGAF